MSRVAFSENTGASIYVFSDDHCPPHVHARHRGDGWIARVRFSYIGNDVELLSVAPVKAIPSRRTLSRLLTDIEVELPACRKIWWIAMQTTCLVNQWAVMTAEKVMIDVSSRCSGDAKQITQAGYDSEQERLRVIFQDGSVVNVSVRR